MADATKCTWRAGCQLLGPSGERGELQCNELQLPLLGASPAYVVKVVIRENGGMRTAGAFVDADALVAWCESVIAHVRGGS